MSVKNVGEVVLGSKKIPVQSAYEPGLPPAPLPEPIVPTTPIPEPPIPTNESQDIPVPAPQKSAYTLDDFLQPRPAVVAPAANDAPTPPTPVPGGMLVTNGLSSGSGTIPTGIIALGALGAGFLLAGLAG